jgi:hypothetical protein
VKILAAVPLYPPSSMVGSWVATHLCLAHMVERGHEVNVVPYMGKGHAYDLDGVHVHPGASTDAFGADVILSHLGDNSKAAEVAKWAKIPSVRMVHGLDPLNQHRLGRRPPALTVFNSESLRRATRWSGPSIVVHPPVEVGQHRCSGDRITLVNLAALKGGGVFAQIAQRMPDHRFLGVRGGYGRQVDQTAANVEVAAPTHRMVADVYARTRVLLMPSKSETWGMVAVEAMACGIPVIASPTPGLRESLGSAGIFADRRNVDEWVAAIRRLDDPDEWQTASERSLERAAELDPAPQLAKFARAVEALA